MTDGAGEKISAEKKGRTFYSRVSHTAYMTETPTKAKASEVVVKGSPGTSEERKQSGSTRYSVDWPPAEVTANPLGEAPKQRKGSAKGEGAHRDPPPADRQNEES